MSPSEAVDFIAAADARADHRTTSQPDKRAVWRLFGAGPPLVLLHGGFGSWLHWLPMLDLLSHDFRLAVPDMPGFGQSDPIPPGATPELIADRLALGIGELFGDAPVRLAGFSFGGLVAAYLSVRLGSRLAGLVLVASGGLGVEREPLDMRSRRRDMSEDDLRAMHAHNLRTLMVRDPEKADALAVEIQMRNTSRRPGLVSRDFSRSRTTLKLIADLKAPVAAAWGEQDPTVVPHLDERVAALRAARPDAATLILKGCGHWIMQERPAELAGFITEAFKRDAPANAQRENDQ
ncbi:alpha/beta hydrolase [Bosea sp. 117]|uniref:alpha/beta fold hydrolase n=1 Tax=Bosea sp. 117 TaxID=1125973 RepID=UPI0018CC634D|nr:alpha/beta hydrolase [Bosea sp. 117]